MTKLDLQAFLIQSNRIEGYDNVTAMEEDFAQTFLTLPVITVETLEQFVGVTTGAHGQPARLRNRQGDDVIVGGHHAPPGGPRIETKLQALLDSMMDGHMTPHETHVAYELLHPFTDGNGRSGRLLWLWQMQREGRRVYPLMFLQTFYYQTLNAAR